MCSDILAIRATATLVMLFFVSLAVDVSTLSDGRRLPVAEAAAWEGHMRHRRCIVDPLGVAGDALVGRYGQIMAG